MCNLCTRSSTLTSKIVFESKTSKYHATCKSSNCRVTPRKKATKPSRTYYNSYCSPSSRCAMECNSPYGLKVYVDRKIKHETEPIQISPKSSSILQKPFIARPCNHNPRCAPPSSCFPFLMPCFWPSRPSAPCSHPNKCFHNPPCPPPRCPKVPEEYLCPHMQPCANRAECIHNTCVAKNERIQDEANCFMGGKKSDKRQRPDSPPRKPPATGKRSKTDSNQSNQSNQSSEDPQRLQKSASPAPSKGSNQKPNQNTWQELNEPEPFEDTLTQQANQFSNLGNQAMSQATSQASQGLNQASQGLNQASNQANQAMSKAASQASQGFNQAASQGNQFISQAENQGNQAIGQAISQGSQVSTQASRQVNQALGKAASQASEGSDRFNPKPQ